jgi:high affinity Mn2+ porin
MTIAILLAFGTAARSQEPPAAVTPDAEPEDYAVHAQFTNVWQYHPAFTSPYRGTNSLDPGSRGNETISLTLFAGIALWQGAEAWVNPEVDQGFGLSNTIGLAGFPSAEAYKIGAEYPYARLHRAFMRQMISLGGEEEVVEGEQNQLGSTRTHDRVTISAGKMGVGDTFDQNSYVADPRTGFMNWTLIDSGAFDYAADSWGYAYGATVDWQQSWWSLRAGLYDMSRVPNSTELTRGFGQYSEVLEAEERHQLGGHDGKVKILAFANHANMGSYDEASLIASQTGQPADIAATRSYHVRAGLALNAEQEVVDDLGVFMRASFDDGHRETYEFTDISRSFAAGLSLNGNRWGRKDDTIGFAGVVNGISNAAEKFFNAGGLGVLVGDGRLPNPAPEGLIETYYKFTVMDGDTITLDYQFFENPAYNSDRGPVSVFGLRLHAEL